MWLFKIFFLFFLLEVWVGLQQPVILDSLRADISILFCRGHGLECFTSILFFSIIKREMILLLIG